MKVTDISPPLMIICQANLGNKTKYLKCAKLLISHGADVNYEHNKSSCLGVAIGLFQLDMIRLLLENGAKIKPENLFDLFMFSKWQGTTIRIRKATDEDISEILNILVKNGCNLYSKDSDGFSFLFIIMQYLCKAIYKSSILFCSAREFYLDTLELLKFVATDFSENPTEDKKSVIKEKYPIDKDLGESILWLNRDENIQEKGSMDVCELAKMTKDKNIIEIIEKLY